MPDAAHQTDFAQGFLSAPLISPDALVPDPFLVLAPHPDDETLAVGGIIAEACARSRPPWVVVVSDGSASHPGSQDFPPERLVRIRREELGRAAETLGLPHHRLIWLGLPDGQVSHASPGLLADDLASRTGAVSAVLTTWRDDPHDDHKATWRIGTLLARCHSARLFEFPVWAWERPVAAPRTMQAWRVDIAAFRHAKRRAVACHGTQLGKVVTDVKNSAVLTPDFLAHFDQPWEALAELDD